LARILIVDDDGQVQDVIAGALRRAGHQPIRAGDSNQALQCLCRSTFDLAIVDLRLPGPDGTVTFRLLRQRCPGLLGIMITGFPDYPGGVVKAMRDGFSDYIEKPFRPADLVRQVEATLAQGESVPRLGGDQTARRTVDFFEGMVGGVPQMHAVFDLIAKVAVTDEPILIHGETGTGKELVARAIHRRSPRFDRPIHVLNCAAAGPDSLLESELFGHERGAFTGASERALGWFEAARGGTLFLDEVSELSLAAQAKLLRAIEYGEISRLGGRQPIRADVRIIAATNSDLGGSQVTFRKDLFHRLNAFVITLPPLRERLADLPQLVQHLLPLVGAALHQPVAALSDDAMRVLRAYPWPGNVRELQQELKKACLRSSGTTLTPEHLSVHLTQAALNVGPTSSSQSKSMRERAREAGHDLQRAWVAEALARTGGNVTKAARLLGVSRRTIQRMISNP